MVHFSSVFSPCPLCPLWLNLLDGRDCGGVHWLAMNGVAIEGELDELAALAQRLGVTFVQSLSAYVPSAEFLASVPIAFARQHKVLGFMGESGKLIVALGDPERLEAVGVVGRFLDRSVTLVLCLAADGSSSSTHGSQRVHSPEIARLPAVRDLHTP